MKKEINYKKVLKWLAIVSCLVVVVSLVVNTMPTVLADVGNNNRYEDSSDSSGGSDSGFIWYITYVLFEMFGPIPGIVLIAVGIIIFLVLKKRGKINNIKSVINDFTNNVSDSTNSGQDISYQSQDQVIANIRESDPSFSSDAFIGWAREVFIKIQQAWTERNWRVIRPFESNELFSQHSSQLQEYINNHKINVIEKIAIQSSVLRDFKQDGDKEFIVVELQVVMRDYVIDDTTRKVLESNPNTDWHMKYLMTFNRKTGVKTHPGTSNKSTTNCPNCGAPTTITSSGQCEYCDSVITTGNHDWVLSDIKSIKR